MNDIVKETLNILDENKGEDIRHLDVSKLTSMTDHMVICTAISQTHARSLAEKVRRHFKEKMTHTPYVEGEEEARWILIDLGDVLVHVMIDEARKLYRLENLWDPALR